MKPNPFWKKISLYRYLAIKLALFLFLYINPGLFAELQEADHVKAELVSEVQSILPGKPFCVALRLKMDERWHIYWKNPGDSGLPPKIEWNLPDGFVPGDIQWPYPQKFETPQIVDFGYEGEVFLITQIKAPERVKSESSIRLSASVDWLVCKESCIPGHAVLNLDLPVKNEKPRIDARWADRFAKTRKNLPKTVSDWKMNAFIKKDKIIIQIAPPSWYKSELAAIMFFPEQVGIIDYSESQNLKKERDRYIIEIQRSQITTNLPGRLKGILFSPEGWSDSRQILALRIDVPLHRY